MMDKWNSTFHCRTCPRIPTGQNGDQSLHLVKQDCYAKSSSFGIGVAIAIEHSLRKMIPTECLRQGYIKVRQEEEENTLISMRIASFLIFDNQRYPQLRNLCNGIQKSGYFDRSIFIKFPDLFRIPISINCKIEMCFYVLLDFNLINFFQNGERNEKNKRQPY